MARILFADDDLDLAEVFAEVLRDGGHDVRIVTDGLAALRAIENWRPDLAVLDLDMPRMTGPSVVAELSRQRTGLERIPIVLLSGNPDVELIATEVRAGYSIAKPITPDAFMSVIDSALGVSARSAS
jgi:CheY-like chemotaxis protein